METRDIDVGAASAAAAKIRAEKSKLDKVKASLNTSRQIITETNDNSATDITVAAIDELLAKIDGLAGSYDSVASGIVSEAQRIHNEYLEYVAYLEEQARKKREAAEKETK